VADYSAQDGAVMHQRIPEAAIPHLSRGALENEIKAITAAMASAADDQERLKFAQYLGALVAERDRRK
jgi:hypothetical protein